MRRTMAQEFAKKFYNSRAWVRCRNAYKASVNHVCERCGEMGDEVHHKIVLTPDNINDPDVTLSWHNLELLCFSCHQRETFVRMDLLRKDVMFDVNGDLIKREAI